MGDPITDEDDFFPLKAAVDDEPDQAKGVDPSQIWGQDANDMSDIVSIDDQGHIRAFRAFFYRIGALQLTQRRRLAKDQFFPSNTRLDSGKRKAIVHGNPH